LQPELYLSLLLVYHARKNVTDRVATGQGLRGSGDIHAFGDPNSYLRRTEQHLIFSSEHPAAPTSSSLYLWLAVTDAAATHLEVITEPTGNNEREIEERVLDLLAQGAVLIRRRLRDARSVNNERLGKVLEDLERAGRMATRLAAGKACVERQTGFIVTTLKETDGLHPMKRARIL
jgi:hypothetical protein